MMDRQCRAKQCVESTAPDAGRQQEKNVLILTTHHQAHKHTQTHKGTHFSLSYYPTSSSLVSPKPALSSCGCRGKQAKWEQKK